MTTLDEAVARLCGQVAYPATRADLSLVLAEFDRRGVELERRRERDAKVRALLEDLAIHLGVATAGVAPLSVVRSALDISPPLVKEALTLLKEEQ